MRALPPLLALLLVAGCATDPVVPVPVPAAPAPTPLQRVPDAYGALRLLAAHPRIDPKRIALMGFSHGGALAMIASTAWAKQTFAPAGQPAFRAYFPFYPNCNADFPERKLVSAPVRIHTGEADD